MTDCPENRAAATAEQEIERLRAELAAPRAVDLGQTLGDLLDAFACAVAANAGHMVVGAEPPDDAMAARAAVEAAVATVVRERDEARRDLDAVGHAMGICYDHDHGCGGHGPIEAMVLAAKDGVSARGDAIDERVRAERAEGALRAVLDGYDGSGQRYIPSGAIRGARAALAVPESGGRG
jgi:hypothetical protein